jgi:hypothetical protein
LDAQARLTFSADDLVFGATQDRRFVASVRVGDHRNCLD